MKVALVLKKSGEFQAVGNLGYFDMKLLKKEVDLVTSIEEADVCVCWKEVPDSIDLNKAVLFQSEPPIASNIKATYKEFDNYLHVFCFNPKDENQSSITSDPISYPYNPASKFQITREDTSMTGKGFFFAGMRRDNIDWKKTCEFGNKVIYALRSEIALKMKELNDGSLILGKGFSDNTKAGDWRSNKYDDINLADNDFMFCCENSIFPNYISEKIHDGFNSDRVTCYLGDPHINSHVPKSAFIDMNDFIDAEGFNAVSFDKFILSLTQSDYDSYLKSAREFRSTLSSRHVEERTKITSKLLDVLKNKVECR